jgi:hypothetical protein
VLLTIGGNDIGFADVIRACADPTVDCKGAIELADNHIGVLDASLQNVYLGILKRAPNARVYVLGYPPLLSKETGVCLRSLPFGDSVRLNLGLGLLNRLNATIKANVKAVRYRYPRIEFVDPTAKGSPFIGHDICSKQPYLHGLSTGVGAFHPNLLGYTADASLLAGVVK